ncbi:MAG: hypothetical protein FJY67_07555 [Calditrichaeota bacterium]|nr:hypothetical protein [Calditrichota bacterium]
MKKHTISTTVIVIAAVVALFNGMTNNVYAIHAVAWSNQNNLFLYGDEINQDYLMTHEDLNNFRTNGALSRNVHVISWKGIGEDDEFHQSIVSIDNSRPVRFATGRSLIVADNVALTIAGQNGTPARFGHFNANGQIDARWEGALILDEAYNVAWDLDPDDNPGTNDANWANMGGNGTDGLSISINWAEFVLGGPVDNENVTNWRNDWGVDGEGNRSDNTGPAVYINFTRRGENSLNMANTRILGSFREDGNNFRVRRSFCLYKALEVHGDGDPNFEAPHEGNVEDWIEMYENDDPNGDPKLESNFENVDVIGWDSNYTGDGWRSYVVEVAGNHFRFTNVKICPDPVYYLVGWGGSAPYYQFLVYNPGNEANSKQMCTNQLSVADGATYNFFDDCLFAQSHKEIVCIEGNGTVFDNCEIMMWHQTFVSHDKLMDFKPRDGQIAQQGDVWNAIRNSVMYGSQGEAIHHSNGKLWVLNNLFHSNGSYWPTITGGNWDLNAGVAVHAGYRTNPEQLPFTGEIFCEPHILNNTFVANAVGIAIFNQQEGGNFIQNTAEFKYNLIYDGLHWTARDNPPAYNRNKCAIWYKVDPTNGNNALKPQYSTV